jgi:hypothetical protein
MAHDIFGTHLKESQTSGTTNSDIPLKGELPKGPPQQDGVQ